MVVEFDLLCGEITGQMKRIPERMRGICRTRTTTALSRPGDLDRVFASLRSPTAAVIALACLVAGCTSTFPGGIVPNADEAVRIANLACAPYMHRFPRAWHAVLVDGEWRAWKPKSGLRVVIDARTGATLGCEVVGKPSRETNGAVD